jgi:hypothetical protein
MTNSEATKPAGCSATTKAGNRCRAMAGSGGLCAAHSGRVDMRELGRRGGKARERTVLGVVAANEAADDSLRALARQQLEELLRSENEQVRLRAASALFSYGSTRPPEAADGQPFNVAAFKARPHSLGEILAFLDKSGSLGDVFAAFDPQLRGAIVRACGEIPEVAEAARAFIVNTHGPQENHAQMLGKLEGLGLIRPGPRAGASTRVTDE